MRVLLVEDDAPQAQAVAEVVRGNGHRVVGVASSADETLSALDDEIPDVALVDIVLHGRREGLEIIESLWHLWRVPSVITSAYDIRLGETEAVASLPKPASAIQLAATLDYVHARQRGLSGVRAPRGLQLSRSAANRLGPI
jgi:DNA-binding response OmpR family regulator